MCKRWDTLHFFEQLAEAEHAVPPDILLLDLTLPQMSGQELLPHIKAIPVCRTMRIVVVTASNYLTTQREVERLGANAFFTKPTTFPAFMQLGDLIKTTILDTTQSG